MSSNVQEGGEVSDEEFSPFTNNFRGIHNLRSHSDDSQGDGPIFAAMRPKRKRFTGHNDLPWLYFMCFFALSFGYMCAWTSFDP